jgi:hypothetical protein
MKRCAPGFLVLALGVGWLGVGCEDKKPVSEAPRSDAGAGTDKYATADPKLTNALAAASASAPSGNGPPAQGIFAEGAADKRHPAGAPTSVDIISEGAEPRVSLLASSADAGDPRAASVGRALLEIMTQTGPRNGLALDFGLWFGPAKKDEGGVDWLVADVKKAVPAERQMGQLAAGTDREIASLEGTSVRIKLTSDGRESDVEVRPGKGMHAELDQFAKNAAEALVLATVPLPNTPVGAGAQWIAETRMPLYGLDVIAYRAYRVKEIDGDRVHLTLNVKAYATGANVKLAGVPPGAVLEQYEAQSQGELELVRGEALPRKYDLQQRAVLMLRAPGAASEKPPPGQPPGNLLTAQLQSQATLVRGDDLRMTTK